MIITEYWPLDVFRPVLLPNVKFGADWTLHVYVSVKQVISCCQQVAVYL